MANFETILDHAGRLEGGFSNIPNDSGAATKFGITEAVARANGYSGSMVDLPLAVARDIMRTQYWEQIHGDQLLEISPALANEVFECAVNCGPATAVLLLQRSLNCFNRRGALYPDIEADGLAGPMTFAALRSYRAARAANWETVLVRALNVLQGARYMMLAESRPKDEDFVFGWILNRVLL